MKTRQGFVSNSSSSSFVMLSTKENIKQALDILSPKERKFIKEQFVTNGSREKVLVDGKEYELRFGTYYTDDWPIDDCQCKVVVKKVPGCNHIVTKGKFCNTCGAPRIKITEVEDLDKKCTCEHFTCEEEIFDAVKLFERNIKPFCFIEEY